MTVIFGTLKDVGGQLAQGTVTVTSLVTRPAHSAAATVITKERHIIRLVDGAFESPELDPGPIRVETSTGGAFESWKVTLPEDGSHDLATLIDAQVEYSPPVVNRVVAAAAGAAAARDGAVAAASRAEGAAGGVAADAVAAGDAAGRAEVAADAADASATAAGVSAGEAAASATAAAGSAEDADASAQSAAGSASQAKVDADWIRGPMFTQLVEIDARVWASADRAESARDQAEAAAERAEASGGGIIVVSSEEEAAALPIGTVYVIAAEVAPGEPGTPEPAPVTIVGTAGENITTAAFTPTIPNATTGDTIIIAANAKAVAGSTLTAPVGFTTLVDGYWTGTQQSWVLTGPWSDDLTVTADQSREFAYAAVAVRGAASVTAGTVKDRIAEPAESTTVTAPAVERGTGDLAIGIAFERTSATETPEQVTVSEGWTIEHYTAQGENFQTTLIGTGGTGDMVATYPNAQATNGAGVQVVAHA